MASCLIIAGIDVNCDVLRQVGGVNKVFYAYNFDELVDVNFDAAGNIDDINFLPYTGLHKFEGRKNSHSGGDTAVIGGVGGNKFYNHNVTAKLFPSTPAEDQTLENLLVATIGIILETNNDEFFLFGLKNGMDQAEQIQNSGTESASDTADALVWIGEEKVKKKRVLVDGSATGTKNFLETLVV